MTVQHNIEVSKNADVSYALEWDIDGEGVMVDDARFAIKQGTVIVDATVDNGRITLSTGKILILIDRLLLAPLQVGAATYDLLTITAGVEDRPIAGGVSVVEGSYQWPSE